MKRTIWLLEGLVVHGYPREILDPYHLKYEALDLSPKNGYQLFGITFRKDSS